MNYIRLMKQKLKESQERYNTLVEASPQAIALINKAYKFIYINSAGLEMLQGNHKDEIIGRSVLDVVHPKHKDVAYERFQQVFKGEKLDFIDYKLIRLDNKIIDIASKVVLTVYKGKPVVMVVANDITSQKRTEEQIKYIAYHDSLTKLPNRNFFYKQLEELIHTKEPDKFKVTILLIDLDRFKSVNDTMGHSFGDQLLKEVAERLKKCVREADVVYRYGGDEFIILLKNRDKEEVEKMARDIVETFSRTFTVGNEEVSMTCSMGVAFYPEDSKDVETLISHADIAMYQAKEMGRDNYELYDSRLHTRIMRRMNLEKGLRRAMENRQFSLHYQPLINLNTNEIMGMEALLRWHHPEFGLISPAEFIPLAEETGFIIPIGKWVLETACKQNKIWHDLGFNNLNIAVNISARQFQDKDFVDTVIKTLNKTKLDPKYLELEITESIMNNVHQLTGILGKLKALGIRIAIDDFGSGYSSLSIIKNLPIDVLKIDKSFIDDILIHHKAAKLLKTIIDMGSNLDFNVTAEGIEKEEQVFFLKAHRCKFGQGYFFSRPLPSKDIEKVLYR